MKTEDGANGSAPIPPNFHTGFRRDLEIAREMIRRRRKTGMPRAAAKRRAA